MEKQILTGNQLIRRTHFLWFPLVIASLLTALFSWAGGGKGHPPAITATGLLKRLPGAFVPPVTHLDKMGYYDLAKRDSVALRQRLTIQSNYARQMGLDAPAPAAYPVSGSAAPPAILSKNSGATADSNVSRIQQKLQALKQAIKPPANGNILTSTRMPPSPAHNASTSSPSPQISSPTRSAPDLSRFDQALRQIQHEDGGNTELRELNTVVEKLLTLQRSQTDTPHKAITAPPPKITNVNQTITALPAEDDTLGAFDSTRIEAIVPEETLLVSGGQLRLQLVSDVMIGRQKIPAGTPVFGTASLTGERLRVSIDAIAAEGHILPVSLEVEDEDGLVGIYIPGAPISEALRESAGQELSAVGPATLSTTLAGQAAGAGVILARSLIGKKIRPVKVTIPAGYHVLLHIKHPGL